MKSMREALISLNGKNVGIGGSLEAVEILSPVPEHMASQTIIDVGEDCYAVKDAYGAQSVFSGQ